MINNNKSIYPCVIGLGYVGLPIFFRLQKKFQTVGYDINLNRINQLKNKKDVTNTILNNFRLRNKSIFSNKHQDIKECNFFIITVPTPIYKNQIPNLEYIKEATKVVAKNLKRGDTIFYESTVYPGVTQKFCIPILEKISKLKSGLDFHVGYSPERINPGDKNHSIDKINKIVSFEDSSIKKKVIKVYSHISKKIIISNKIQEAETSKVIENIQRDLNIALINEIYKVCKKLNINFSNVIKLAKTKWNFLSFSPGLVGGHCLPVDPYYLSYIARKNNIKTRVILAGRSVNNSMENFLFKDIKNFLSTNNTSKSDKILFLGATYKPNVPDIRNSLSLKIFNRFKKHYNKIYLHDPLVSNLDISKSFLLKKINNIKIFKCIIVMVKHNKFKNLINKIKKNKKVKLLEVLT